MATPKKMRTRRALQTNTFPGCPLTRSQLLKCFRTCQPGKGGLGRCGRQAPHGVKSRIQLAIENHKKRTQAELVTVS